MFIVQEYDKDEGLVFSKKEYKSFEDLLAGLQEYLVGTAAHPALEALKVEECTEIHLEIEDIVLNHTQIAI